MAREPVVLIIRLAGQAPRQRSRLSSNVRRRKLRFGHAKTLAPMRSEFTFFMAPEDEREFLELVRRCGLTREDRWLLSESVCSGQIQYLPSLQVGSVLTLGRISISTSTADSRETDRAASLAYQRLRRELRRTFSNDLVAYTDGVRSKYEYRSLWLGPHALAWLRRTRGASLRQAVGYRSNFVPRELAPEGDA